MSSITRILLITAATLCSFLSGASGVQIWSSPGAIPTGVPASCRAALSQNITCANTLVTADVVVGGGTLVGQTATDYCTNGCYTSLKSFQTNVDSRCGNKPYSLWPNSTLTQIPSVLADGLVWAYNISCIQDSSAQWHEDGMFRLYAALWRMMLSSDYGRAKFQPDQYSSLLSTCGVSASKYPYTYTPMPTATIIGSQTSTVTVQPTSTCNGEVYTVGPSDTCESISEAASVAIDRMITSNNLDYGCRTLKAGTLLCLQDTCTLHKVKLNETCNGLVKGEAFSTIQLISWNPTIHYTCDNLDSMVGRSICLSPPGGGQFDYNSTKTTGGPSSLTSPMFTSWVSDISPSNAPNFTTSWYTPTIPSDYSPPTATVGTNSSQEDAISARMKYCWITAEDEENGFSDEDLPAGCQPLLETYCYPMPNSPVPTSPAHIPAVCTPDRSNYLNPNATSTADSAPPVTPTPVQPHMVSGCQQFYNVQNGETCAIIVNRFGVSLQEFYLWNPDVGSSCQALYRSYYVCVLAPV